MGGGQVMQHFYKQLQTVLKNCFTIQNLATYSINLYQIMLQVSTTNNASNKKKNSEFIILNTFNINFVWLN